LILPSVQMPPTLGNQLHTALNSWNKVLFGELVRALRYGFGVIHGFLDPIPLGSRRGREDAG
jgi:hypothetical protein